jgi:DNA-binding winged helix-turn-helix (wHTH) protein
MTGDFTLGDRVVHPSLCRIIAGGTTVTVRAKVMDLLVYLAQHQGEVVSKDTLLNDVWKTEAVSESALTRTVTELRQALADDADYPTVLETIPKRGYRLIAPVVFDLPPETASAVPHLGARPGRRWVTAVIVVAVGIAAFLLGRMAGPTTAVTPGPTTQFSVDVPGDGPWPYTGQPLFALAPDARRLAFQRGGKLFVRDLTGETVQLADGVMPFFSPDGQWLGFLKGTKLMKVSVRGGGAVTICDVVDPRGASWGDDDRIVYADETGRRLMRVVAAGGTPERLLSAEEGHLVVWPFVLPGSRAVLFTDFEGMGSESGVVKALQPGGGPAQSIVRGADAVFAMNRLFYGRGASLWSVRFDPATLATSGEPAVALAEVARYEGNGGRQVALSAHGSIAYLPSYPATSTIPVLVDRSGREEPLAIEPGPYEAVRLSFDGTSAALSGGGPFAVIDLKRLAISRPAKQTFPFELPVWMPSGDRVVYRGDRSKMWSLDMAGVREPELVQPSPNNQYPHDATPDGRTLIYSEQVPGGGLNLFTLEGGGTPKAVTPSAANERGARISRDGRWLAYESAVSGTSQVYVRALAGGRSVQASPIGGRSPVWSRDRRQLYFVRQGMLMGLAFDTGVEFEPGLVEPLFDVSRYRTEVVGAAYDVMPGERMLMLKNVQASAKASITVVLNWMRE